MSTATTHTRLPATPSLKASSAHAPPTTHRSTASPRTPRHGGTLPSRARVTQEGSRVGPAELELEPGPEERRMKASAPPTRPATVKQDALPRLLYQDTPETGDDAHGARSPAPDRGGG